MKNMEQIRKEDKLSKALPVSIIHLWRYNGAVNTQQDKHKTYIVAQNL